MGYWQTVSSKAFTDTWELISGAKFGTILIGLLIFAVTLVLMRRFRGHKDMKDTAIETSLGFCATLVVGILIFIVHLLFISPSKIYSDQHQVIDSMLSSGKIRTNQPPQQDTQSTNVARLLAGFQESKRIFIDSQLSNQPNIAALRQIASAPAPTIPDGRALDISAAEDVVRDFKEKAAAKLALSQIESRPLELIVLSNCIPTIAYCISNVEKGAREVSQRHGDRVVTDFTNVTQLLEHESSEITMEANRHWKIQIKLRAKGSTAVWNMYHDPFDFLCSISGERYSYYLQSNRDGRLMAGDGDIRSFNPTNFNSALSMLIALETLERPLTNNRTAKIK